MVGAPRRAGGTNAPGLAIGPLAAGADDLSQISRTRAAVRQIADIHNQKKSRTRVPQ
jgi:hypothetical protein